MSTVFALMVGIERYRAAPRLYGCRTDIADALEYLTNRSEAKLEVVTLFDDEATGEALVGAFRTHLRQAGPGDIALFWFSGHGSQAPVPTRWWHLEPDGRTLQTLVCADSRDDDRPDLLDKELAVLLDEVAASGTHVVAVLDCCHSGGAVRSLDFRPRSVRPARTPPSRYLLPDIEERYSGGAPALRFVLLAACQAREVGGEQKIDGRFRGIFTWALLGALRRARPGTTYRGLVTLANNEIERLGSRQTPIVYPPGTGRADQLPFGAAGVAPAPPAIILRYAGDGWEIDAGTIHGIRPGSPGYPTRVAVTGPPPLRELAVYRVESHRSLVSPLRWTPDPDTVYPVVVSGFHSPSTAAPAGSPPRPAVAAFEHIARWRRVRYLNNPSSLLSGAVSVELVVPRPGDVVAPFDGPAVTPDSDGVIRLDYAYRSGRWVAPERFVRLRNTARRPLYCVLLNLTDRYAIDASLFRGDEIEAGAVAAAGEGRRVEFALPEGRPIEPGASAHDWLMLIVSDRMFASAPLELPPVGVRVSYRDLWVTSPGLGQDWATLVVPVVTRVPDRLSRSSP